MTPDRSPRFLTLLLLAALMGPLYVSLSGDLSLTFKQLLLSLAIAAAAALYWRSPGRASVRAALTVLLIACLPLFYGATGPVIRAWGRARRDQLLIDWDMFLFEGIFPGGQISYFFDRSAWLNPGTAFGRVFTEFLQIMYFSYYVWGFALLGYLLWRWGSGLRAPSLAPEELERRWRELRLFVCAWVGTFLVNFLGYLWIPAIGPQFTMADHYVNELEGLWLTPHIRGVVRSGQATLEDCFPSGHTALSWVAGLYAIRLTPRYGRWALAAAPFVTLATVYLRYHYVVDLIAAVPLIGVGLWWGGWRSLKDGRKLEA